MKPQNQNKVIPITIKLQKREDPILELTSVPYYPD